MRVAAFLPLILISGCLGLQAQSPSTVLPTPAAQRRSIGPSVRQVSPGMTYHRVWVISPLTGSGTPGDPKRPLFVPAPPARTSAAPARTAASDIGQTGLLGFQMQLSDDANYALVELVYATPLAFQNALKNEAASRNITVSAVPTNTGAVPAAPLNSAGVSTAASVSASLESALTSAVPGLQIFERGQATQAQIQFAFQQKKASFNFNWGSVRPQ